MNEAKEKTALCTSVGADERQSVQNTISSISALDTEINHPDENSPENFEDIMRQMQRMSDPAYLHTVSMNELYETVYQSRPPVIDGLLYSGTYLFAGAPKVGKSFFMAQLAYHISTGQPLWNYEVHQGTVLYLALEDDYQRLQERMSRMFGVVSDSPDFIGISAICHDIDSVSQVADLLDVEYASYELLVVMDARLKPELFHEMLRHYRMMRVDYHPFEACSQLGVRGFYRSQTRGVNRLTLLDQMEAFSAVSSDAAVRAASYDYILPIGRNLRLKRGAIDLLAMELAVHPIHSISFVRTAVGPSLRLYAREYVGRLGRFDRADGYELSRKERITLYEPLFYDLHPSRYAWILTLGGMSLLAGCAVVAWVFGWLPVTLLLLDILLLWGLSLWLNSIAAPVSSGKRDTALGAM